MTNASSKSGYKKKEPWKHTKHILWKYINTFFKTNEALELQVYGKRFILSKDKGFSLSPWDLLN